MEHFAASLVTRHGQGEIVRKVLTLVGGPQGEATVNGCLDLVLIWFSLIN